MSMSMKLSAYCRDNSLLNWQKDVIRSKLCQSQGRKEGDDLSVVVFVVSLWLCVVLIGVYIVVRVVCEW